ncbi:MAG: DUF6262 family protein [Desulfuromonadaceae bacterium]
MSVETASVVTSHEEKVNKAYTAIAALRKRGNRVTITSVVKESGLARGTLYSEDSDWKEVREVIEGKKTSPRVALAEVELTETQKWERQVRGLENRLKVPPPVMC